MKLEARLRATEEHDYPAVSPPPPAPLPIYNVGIDKEFIPSLCGDTPATQPLRRNQEVEAWIRHTENVVKRGNGATITQGSQDSYHQLDRISGSLPLVTLRPFIKPLSAKTSALNKLYLAINVSVDGQPRTVTCFRETHSTACLNGITVRSSTVN